IETLPLVSLARRKNASARVDHTDRQASQALKKRIRIPAERLESPPPKRTDNLSKISTPPKSIRG
ncbi:hypothetical protein FRC06_003237, partial [Ceratobasidium sp. 370]